MALRLLKAIIPAKIKVGLDSAADEATKDNEVNLEEGSAAETSEVATAVSEQSDNPMTTQTTSVLRTTVKSALETKIFHKKEAKCNENRH